MIADLFDSVTSTDFLPLAVPTGFGVVLAASGTGLGVGACFRDYRTIQPLLIVTVAATA